MDDSTLPAPFSRVLEAEYRALHGGTAPVPDGDDGERTAALRRAALAEGHSALCLSGGGIRSASFSIGVLQGLAALGVLERFHYLSTVSGGGYAGGWFSAWRFRADAMAEAGVYDQLAGRRAPPGEPEPAPLAEVRRLCRFLDPRVGVLSADVWTLAVTILRNLLLNWIVLLPLLAAGLLVPHLYLSILDLPSQPEIIGHAALQRLDGALWIAGVVTLVASMAYIALDLPSLGDRRWSQRRFLGWFLVPVCLTEALLSVSAAWRWVMSCQHHSLPATAAVSAAALAAPGIVGLVVGRRGWRAWTWTAVFVAGGLGGAALWALKARHLMAATVFTAGAPGCADALAQSSAILPTYAALDLPASLALLAVEFMLLAGLSGRAMSDEDREWWARATAWLLIVAVTWFVAGGLVLVAHAAVDRALTMLAGISLGSVAGKMLLAALTLGTGGAASKSGARLTRRGQGRLPAIVFALAAPAFVALLLLLLASIDESLLVWLEGLHFVQGEGPHPHGGGLVEVMLLFTALSTVGLVAGRRVSVNIFSLHGMYRSRLVRTFVGASRPSDERRPSRFTGFDPADDVPVAGLADRGRPLHVLNCTLNLVHQSGRLGQERKGAAFTVSPFHVGSRDLGYRPTGLYAEGLTLGHAITISGAAVAPQMGDHSAPFLTFLLTLFNARLGVWLGNPGPAGEATWRTRDPGLGPGRLLGEMFGQTSTTNPYVYLSDGGHFENLGLYEMVARSCRTIVVVDAGCDPAYAFDDLGNAIRRIRIDLGIPVEFLEPPAMTAARQGAGNPHAALGRIRYSALDATLPDGTLVYLKATLSGDEPVDVLNYAASHAAFPHEPTTNQWFGEAQFESYRVLGRHSVATSAAGMEPRGGIEAFAAAVATYVAAAAAETARAATTPPTSNPPVNRA